MAEAQSLIAARGIARRIASDAPGWGTSMVDIFAGLNRIQDEFGYYFKEIDTSSFTAADWRALAESIRVSLVPEAGRRAALIRDAAKPG